MTDSLGDAESTLRLGRSLQAASRAIRSLRHDLSGQVDVLVPAERKIPADGEAPGRGKAPADGGLWSGEPARRFRERWDGTAAGMVHLAAACAQFGQALVSLADALGASNQQNAWADLVRRGELLAGLPGASPAQLIKQRARTGSRAQQARERARPALARITLPRFRSAPTASEVAEWAERLVPVPPTSPAFDASWRKALGIPPRLIFPLPQRPPLSRYAPANGSMCSIFGLECNKIPAGKVPLYQNANTAIPLGLEFWTGHGARNQYFNQWDPFTQMLMRDHNVQETIAIIKNTLRRGGGVHMGTHDYRDPKSLLQVAKDLLGSFTDGRIGSNPADGFLGSYTLGWVALPTSDHAAIVYFTAQNTTDLNSVFHPEYITHGLIRSVDGMQPFLHRAAQDLVGTPSGIGLELFSPFPGSEKTMIQTVQWQQAVSY